MKIRKLLLNNFRNHGSFAVDIDSDIIAITGKNGMGKTNIMEALSLLVPGKGFHKSKLSEFQKQQTDFTNPWSVFAEIENDDETTPIGTGFDTAKFNESGIEKRMIRINGETQRGQNSLAEYVSMIWLTPAQDLTFASGTLSRDFLDSICELFFPDYQSALAIYHKARMQRRNLLQQHKYDDIWLSALETQMTHKAISITHSRMEVIERLNQAMAFTKNSSFPAALVEIEGEIETIIRSRKSVEAEAEYSALLKGSRSQDAYSGKTNHGPHRTKLKVTHLGKNQVADLCSTGEQKAMLLSIILSAVSAKRNFSGITPIVLLDEIIAHLDSEKRRQLLQSLLDINAQIWASAVDFSDFAHMGEKVQNIAL